MINVHECVNVYVILGFYNLQFVLWSEYETYQLDLIVMFVVVNDMPKFSYSAIGGGRQNTATGS